MLIGFPSRRPLPRKLRDGPMLVLTLLVLLGVRPGLPGLMLWLVTPLFARWCAICALTGLLGFPRTLRKLLRWMRRAGLLCGFISGRLPF
jgi:hypothetical protein